MHIHHGEGTTTLTLFWSLAAILAVILLFVIAFINRGKRSINKQSLFFMVCAGVVLVAALMYISGHDAQLATGLNVVTTLALAFAAFWAITRNEAQTNKLIENGKAEEKRLKNERLLNEIIEWVDEILKESYSTSALPDIYELAEIFSKADKSVKEYKQEIKYREKKNASAVYLRLSSLLSKKDYIINLAKHFSLDNISIEFVSAVESFQEYLKQEISEKTNIKENKSKTEEETIKKKTLRDIGINIIKQASYEKLKGTEESKIMDTKPPQKHTQSDIESKLDEILDELKQAELRDRTMAWLALIGVAAGFAVASVIAKLWWNLLIGVVFSIIGLLGIWFKWKPGWRK